MAQHTVGLVLHPSRAVHDSVSSIVAWAAAHEVTLLAREQDSGRLDLSAAAMPAVSDDEFTSQVESVISLGGDGTMLGALRLVAERPVPVMGVNHGHLGFLIELEPADLDGALDRLITGDFVVEPQSGLSVTLTTHDQHEGQREQDGEREQGPWTAFNDVVLTRRGQAHSVSLDLVVGDDRYGYYRCDAVIVSTPTGSTAYNYAAGGPVISPAAAATVITPVAPMAGISRSVVLGASESVRLEVPHGTPYAGIELDGVRIGTLRGGESVRVALVPDAGLVVRFDRVLHSERNRVKLSLLDLPLRRDQLLDLVPADLRERAATEGRPTAGP